MTTHRLKRAKNSSKTSEYTKRQQRFRVAEINGLPVVLTTEDIAYLQEGTRLLELPLGCSTISPSGNFNYRKQFDQRVTSHRFMFLQTKLKPGRAYSLNAEEPKVLRLCEYK